MSALLDSIPGELIPASITPAQLQGNIKGKLTAQSWRVVAEDTSSVPCTLYVVPPASESIGNAQTREVLSFEFGGDYINLRPVCEALLAYPQTITLKENTLALGGGTVTNSLTLNGVTVSQSPAAQVVNTAAQNLRYLIEALAASTNDTISDWIWQWSPAPVQNSYEPYAYIYGIRKTAAVNQAVSVAGCLGGTSGNYAAAGLQSYSVARVSPGATIPVDLASGFISFIQVSARGLAIGNRCNSGYYGVIHAVWGDHHFALDSMPAPTPGWEQFLSPIELMVGPDQSESTISDVAIGLTAKVWNLGQCANNLVGSDGFWGAHPFTRVWPRGVFIDCNVGANANSNINYLISGSSPTCNTTLDDWPIHRVEGRETFISNGNFTYQRAAIIPTIQTEDWWRYRGGSPNENALCGAKDAPFATLTTALTRGGTDTSIGLSSVAGRPATGTVIIEGEPIPYTGISGNTLTGCSRGAYGQEKAAHAVGTAVSQGHYWVKINGGLIYCGLQQPVQG